MDSFVSGVNNVHPTVQKNEKWLQLKPRHMMSASHVGSSPENNNNNYNNYNYNNNNYNSPSLWTITAISDIYKYSQI